MYPPLKSCYQRAGLPKGNVGRFEAVHCGPRYEHPRRTAAVLGPRLTLLLVPQININDPQVSTCGSFISSPLIG
jgi:hypothetical protein